MDMTGKEIGKQIAEQRKDGQVFIKWWRKEEDWLDFDLLETFVETVDPDEEIGGFDLLTMEEMWEQVQKVCASRVEKTKKRGEDVVVWQKGEGEELVCPFTPEALLHIFDTETHGDFVD
jgi:hypothetical protein